MIYFHKILPLLTAPIFVVLLLLIIGLVMKRSAFSIIGLTILLIFSNPLFAEWAIRQAEKPFVPINIDSLQKSDFVVVLSGDATRFDTALRILEKDKAAKMIVTAGKTPWEKKQLSDGHQYMNVAKQIGMKSDKILITGVVQNTEQEVVEISKIIPTESNLILVTSAIHMTRAKMLFENAGFETVAFPNKFFTGHKTTPMSFIPSASALSRSSNIYREFQGRLFYSIKHSLKSLFA